MSGALNLTKRQKDLLKFIVEEYISTANAVGSKTIVKKYMPNVSAATIRNEMAILEDNQLLEKNHTSSGRVPSIHGYKFYEKNLSEYDVSQDDLKLKLKKIFSNRNQSINLVIEQTCKILSEGLNLPLVMISKEKEVLLKRIDLIEITKTKAMVIVITSDGNLNKTIINFDKETFLKDISICVRIFNDRLVDCPIDKIEQRIELIKNLIREKVVEYEFVIQELIEKIFHIKLSVNKVIHGQKQIVSVPEFQEKEKLKEILEILDSTSVWDQIAFVQNKTGKKTMITFGDEINHKDVVFAQTELEMNDQSETKLFMVAPTRINYAKIKGLLEFIQDEFEKGFK